MRPLAKRMAMQYRTTGKAYSEVSRATGISRQQVANYAKDRVKEPVADVVTAIARALDDDPEEYLSLAGHYLLKAEGLIPMKPAPITPELLSAVQEAVQSVLRAEMVVLGEAMERAVVARLQGQPEGGGSAGQPGFDVPQRDPV